MKIRILAVIASFLSVTGFTCAQQLSERIFVTAGQEKEDSQTEDKWWGYFDGDISSVVLTGPGSDYSLPIYLNCAIKVPGGDPATLGKRIKAMRYAFFSLDGIEDVKVWMTHKLYPNVSKSDICCHSVNQSDLVDLDKDGVMNEFFFNEPYQIGNKDVYVGYSFKLTSYETLNQDCPIVVSYSQTEKNAFFINWGDGWRDLSRKNFGNLALRLYLDDDGVFLLGDSNYDLKVDVVDVTTVLEYMLKGNVSPFNKEYADIDGNGEINIVDAASIVDMILERYETPDKTSDVEEKDAVAIFKDDNGFGISLTGNNTYKAFQMDVVLPEGCNIDQVVADRSVSASHSVVCRKIADDRYRVIVYSLNGNEISPSNSRLINIETSAKGVRLENIIFATSDLMERRFAAVNTNDITGIEDIQTVPCKKDVYTVEGIKISNSNKLLDKGVYIVDGKKIVIK